MRWVSGNRTLPERSGGLRSPLSPAVSCHMQLELTEPQLYFGAADGSAGCMAAAIQRGVIAERMRALQPAMIR